MKKLRWIAWLLCAAMLVTMLPTPVLAGNETDVCHIVHTEADDPGEGAIDTLPEVTEVSAAEVTEESTGEAAEKPTVETTVETTQVSADEATEAAEKLPGVSAKADPQTQAYQGNATWTGSYLNSTDGVTWTTETASDVHVITSSDTTWSSGWYVVTGDVSITGNNGKGAVIVNGDVKLILADGASLTVDGGINVSSGNTLTIYAQSTGDNMGKLTSSATSRAGIGANWDSTAGTMVFNGGRLSFTGANGINTGNGVLIVNGGVVDAVSNGNGDAAIGGEGWNNGAGSITINGGTVTATATAEDLYGIGFFVMCDDMNSTLTINGGVLIMDTIHAAIYSGVAVTLGRDSALKVTAGEKADIASAVEYSQRGDTSFWRENYVKVEPCVSHTIMTGSVSYYDTQYHTDGFCRWCGAGTPIPHSYDETTGLCACGAWSGTYLDCDKDGRNWVTRSTSGVQQFDTKSYTLTGGWYVAVGEVTFSNSAEVSGDLKLILADGANLTFSQGFTVTEGNSLTIYAQSTGERMGKLNATGIGSYGAAIGGCGDHNCGTVTINGGMINAKGGGYTPAIGGGDRSDAGIVTINGGVINAEGGKCAPGIGGGAEYEGTNAAGTITINGGTVVAKGRDGARGIGSGYYYIRYGTRPRYVGGSGGTVTINGGSVTAVGGITNDTTSVNYRAPQAFDTAPTLNQNVGWKRYFGSEETQLRCVYAAQLTGSEYTDHAAAKIEVCPHEQSTGSDYVDERYHGASCSWCGMTSSQVSHSFGDDGKCVCGAWRGTCLQLDQNGENWTTMTVVTPNVISGGAVDMKLTAGWYVLDNCTLGSAQSGIRIGLSGEVNLILPDGSTNSVYGNFYNADSGELRIYAQSTGKDKGSLYIKGAEAKKGIPNPTVDGVAVTVNGGSVQIHGGDGNGDYNAGAAIGGNLTVNGGEVLAQSADIGDDGWTIGGALTLNGGTLTVVTQGSMGAIYDKPATKTGTNWKFSGGTVAADLALIPAAEYASFDVLGGRYKAVRFEICAVHMANTQAEGYPSSVDMENHKELCKWCGGEYLIAHSFNKYGICACGASGVAYLDYNGESKTWESKCRNEFEPLDAADTALTDGWYVVFDSCQLTQPLTISGNVCLILVDGTELTVKGGISGGAGSSLTVYAQSAPTADANGVVSGGSVGKLTITDAVDGSSAINADSVTINGGIVRTDSGICGGSISVNGGFVDADGKGTVGIGGDGTRSNVTVTITGGIVNARGAGGFAGIGGKTEGERKGAVSITGGTVTAQGGSTAAGIGCTGSVTISGGAVTAKGGAGAPGVGQCSGQGGEPITIENGTVTVIGGEKTESVPAHNAFDQHPVIGKQGNRTGLKLSSGDSVPMLTPVEVTGNAFGKHAFRLERCISHEKTDVSGYCDTVNHSYGCKWCDTPIYEAHTYIPDESGKVQPCGCGAWKGGYRDYTKPGYVFNFTETQITGVRPVTAADTEWTAGFYAVVGTVTIDNRITVTGDVTLILTNGSSLTVNGGIDVSDNSTELSYNTNSLTVTREGNYTGSARGTLTVRNVPEHCAGIGGGDGKSGGTIKLLDGTTNVTGGIGAAGVGGGYGGDCGRISFDFGNVTVVGGEGAVGVGAGVGGTGGTGGRIILTQNSSVTSSGIAAFGVAPYLPTGAYFYVLAGESVDAMTVKTLEERTDTLFTESKAVRITYCSDSTHGIVRTFKDEEVDDTYCKYCGIVLSDSDPHSYDETTGICPCGVMWSDGSIKARILRQSDIDSVNPALPAAGSNVIVLADMTLGTAELPLRVKTMGQTLILADNVTLTLNGGLVMGGTSHLTITALSSGANMGKLVVRNVPAGCMGIGVDADSAESCGALTINGGDITIFAGTGAAAIGSRGSDYPCVNGGIVTAVSDTAAFAGKPNLGGGTDWKISTGVDADSLTIIPAADHGKIDYSGSGAIRLEPCTQHSITVYTHQDETNHAKGCSICGTSILESHSFNEQTGQCVCGALRTAYLTCDAHGDHWTTETYIGPATIITPDTVSLTDGWYVVNGNVTIGAEGQEKTVEITGNTGVNLILLDDSGLTVNGNISVRDGTSLRIYGQSTGDHKGKLTVQNAPANCAGIGGNINASGGEEAAGIGDTDGFTLKVYGGVIHATGGTGAPGIGSTSGAGSTVSVMGGEVTAIGGGDKAYSAAPTLGENNWIVSAGTSASNLTVVPPDDRTDELYTTNCVVKLQLCTEHLGSVCYFDPTSHALTCLHCGSSVCFDHSFAEGTGLCTCGAVKTTYLECDADGKNWKTIENAGALPLDASSSLLTVEYPTLTAGWYVVSGDVTFGTASDSGAWDRLNLSGDVKLILSDGCSLNVYAGIEIPANSSLTIYAQSKGDSMGRLNAFTVNSAVPAIGADLGNVGTINMKGGSITADGSSRGTGIGARGRYGATINIYDGIINATGANDHPAIGGGGETMDKALYVNIYGGSITATGKERSAGIGTGQSSSSQKLWVCGGITINGGTIHATGGDGAAGIGGGFWTGSLPITINGGTIVANGGGSTVAIGDGCGYDDADHETRITINGGKITANGGFWGDALGDSIETRPEGRKVIIEINGGELTAVAGEAFNAESPTYAFSVDPTLNLNAYNYYVGTSLETLASVALSELSPTFCTENAAVRLIPCTHPDGYTVDGICVDGATHTAACPYCGRRETLAHVFPADSNGFCSVCGEYQPAVLNTDGYYEIGNAGQFKWFCREIDGGERSINGKLIADISLKNIPYSSVTILYCGIFDGNGYTISDMTMITDQNLASGERVYQYYGLFGGLGAGAVVRDLTLRGSITCTTAATQIGSVAGYATGGARIANVTSYVNIGDGGQKLDGIQKVGGIVGCAKDGSSVTVVENCQYYGKINLTSASEVGGIVGYAADNSQTVGCCNHGSVYVGSGYHTGGIVGAGFSGALIERCMNFGSVEMHNHDCLGGILGYANAKVVIRNCGNVGTVSGYHSSTDSPDAYVGGILGYVNNSNFGGLTGCYNYGTVSATQNDTYCGAIVGWGRSGATYTKITNNYYLEGEKPFGTINDAGVTAVSANRDQFASGEVAYMLNGGVTDGTQAWYQRIGSDASPKLSGGTVYFEDGGYNNGAVTVSVEISWTSMEFTYTDGDWDSNTHDYEEGQWSTEGGTITVRNTASAQVSVELDFAPTVEGLTGTLTKRSMLLGENESDTTALALAGRPTAEISNAAIGEVTVTIAQPTSEAPKEGE